MVDTLDKTKTYPLRESKDCGRNSFRGERLARRRNERQRERGSAEIASSSTFALKRDTSFLSLPNCSQSTDPFPPSFPSPSPQLGSNFSAERKGELRQQLLPEHMSSLLEILRGLVSFKITSAMTYKYNKFIGRMNEGALFIQFLKK